MNSVETVCEDCGLVVAEHRIDHGPEWRRMADDGSTLPRTGAPLTPTRHDRGLSTEIGRKSDGNGNTLSGQKRCQLGRLRREHNRGRWRSKAEQNLAHGLAKTRRVASVLDLPASIHDQACALYRSASSEDLLPGRSIEAVAAASVYAACRCNALPRTLPEVGNVAKVVSSTPMASSIANSDSRPCRRRPEPTFHSSRQHSGFRVGHGAGRRHSLPELLTSNSRKGVRRRGPRRPVCTWPLKSGASGSRRPTSLGLRT